MSNLIKLDLLKIVKDKLFIIMCAVALGTSLFTPIAYKIIELIIRGTEAEGMVAASARELAFAVFSPTGAPGLILIIFMPIILHKEYSNGVIRNKIIYGKSRESIYFSLFISAFIIMFGVMLVIASISFVFSLVFFNYVPEGTTVSIGNDIASIFMSLLFEAFIYVFIVSLTMFFTIGVGSIPLSIVVPVVSSVLLSLLSSILTYAAKGSKAEEIVSYINIFRLAELISIGKYPMGLFIAMFVTPTIYSAIFISTGYLVFKNKSVK